MPAIKHRALGLLSGLAAALALLPASAQGASSCSQAASGSAMGGCGGNGQAQVSGQNSTTTQAAQSEAEASQDVKNANLPSNNAISNAYNSAGTKQGSYQWEGGGNSSCSVDCGANYHAQVSGESSTTTQTAASEVEAKQDVSNANLPVNASNSDGRDASNNAQSRAGNQAQTSQSNGQQQQEEGSSCSLGCGGNGQAQLSFEEATTTQTAESEARATQNIRNSNSGEGEASNSATSGAYNNAGTKQSSYQSQESGSSSCSGGCGVDNQAQVSEQSAITTQTGASEAQANPNVASVNLSADSGRTEEGNVAAESNTTTQLIWQMQLSECIARCVGTKQSQAAEQQDNAVQVLNGPSPAGEDHGTEVAESDPRADRNVTQIQLGCVLHCFGTTTTTRAPMLASYVQAVEQTVRSIGINISKLIGTPAVEQNTVEQISYQSQRGPRGVGVQTQSASQTSTAVQEYSPSSLIAGLQQALERSAAASPEAVNQAEQRIWQLQAGCLMFCSETELYQRAAQSSSTVQDGAAPETVSTSTSSSTQLIWQAQIGCLLWCFDSTEQQTAVTQNMAMVREGEGTSAPTPAEPPTPLPGEAPPPSPGLSFPLEVTDELAYVSTLVQAMFGPAPAGVVTAAEHPQPAPAAVNPASGGTDISLTSTGTGMAVLQSPAAAREDGSMPTANRPADSAARHLPAAQHRREARATRSFAAQRANVQLALAAPRAHIGRSVARVAAVAHVLAAARTGLSDTTLRSGVNLTPDVPLATLLSAFALWGLCVFGIAVAAARRDLRAGKPGAGG
jgi:hypothetical protein